MFFLKTLIILISFAPSSLWAFSQSQALPRKILALSQISSKEDVSETPTHFHAEMVLNHLGLEVVHRSIQDPLPSPEEMKEFLGVLSWFQQVNAVPNPSEYCVWMKKQILTGKKFVILEEPGFFKDKRRNILPVCQAALRQWGAVYKGNFSDNPYFFEIASKNSAMVEFERNLLPSEKLLYSQWKVLSPQSPVYLKARRLDLEASESDLVFVTPHGGFAHPSYVRFVMQDIEKIQWRLNPFSFFEKAFGVEARPRPDTTTLNGRRIFFTHIDGDGIVNLSHIDNESFSGEIIHREILKKYRTLPISASIITGYLDMREYQGKRLADLYRAIFSPSNVEALSHGHAHPLVWKEGKLSLKVPGFVYSPRAEISESLLKLRTLLQSLGIPKPVSLFSWTGDCLPTEEQLSIPYQLGIKNLNGGDPHFDKKYDSLSFVAPLGLLRGRYRQIYTAAPNEIIYTNKWEGPYYGFSNVIETFKNTESPLRLKPLNVYYHYYSGERQASLKALKEVYDFALAQDIFPIFATDYVAIVEDFFAAKIFPLAGGGWRVLNRGSLRTIRFDKENRGVDVVRSKGVIGFRHLQGSLYVFLDPSESHDIYLTFAPPKIPYLEAASFHLKDFRAALGRISFSKRGWHKSEMVLAGLPPGSKYQALAGGERFRLRSDSKGRLTIVFPEAENGGEWRTVILEAN